MKTGKKVGIAVIWMVVVGVIVIIAMGINDVTSMAQYYGEAREQFVKELKAATKLAQAFELPNMSLISYKKGILTVVLSDRWRDTTAGASVTATYQIEGDNLSLIGCTASDGTVGVVVTLLLGVVFSVLIGIILTNILIMKKPKKE
jgi:hypothetical protein